MALSSTYENTVLNWLFTTGAVTRPTGWNISLHSGNPGSTGANELSGNGYARAAGTLTVSGNVASNSGTITFAASGGAWTAATYAGVWDTAGTPNFIAGGPIIGVGAGRQLAAAGIVSGGSGYVAGDVSKTVSLSGGTSTTTATITITAVSGGAVTGVQVTTAGAYSVLPGTDQGNNTSTGIATTGGGTTGSGLTVDGFWTYPAYSVTLNNGDSATFSAGAFAFTLT